MNDNPNLISFLTIRKSIGILGISLPAILILGTFTIGGCEQIQSSISHYYFTIMGDVFVGILCAVSLFLITYKGYAKSYDNIATNLAGIFALGVAFFPSSQNTDTNCAILYLSDCNARITIHYISAALFFLTLAYISAFLFTKSKGNKTIQKVSRNRFYRICSIVILFSILVIFLLSNNEWLETHLQKYKPVFWFEWLALLAFGISWLIKGEMFLKDEE